MLVLKKSPGLEAERDGTGAGMRGGEKGEEEKGLSGRERRSENQEVNLMHPWYSPEEIACPWAEELVHGLKAHILFLQKT